MQRSLMWVAQPKFSGKSVNIYRIARMGRNFDDYPGFQQIPLLLQQSVCVLRKIKINYFIFHHQKNWCNFISEHVGVCCCCQPFSCHGYNVKTLRKLIKEPWMTWQKKEIYCTMYILTYNLTAK